MTNISSLPEELLLHIISFLPRSDLITVWNICKHWRNLSRRPLAAKIQSSLTYWWSYNLSYKEMDIAADLVTTGYLSEVGMKKLATRIQGSWSRYDFYPSVAEVRCAATLAATGHLTEVKYMNLRDLELTGIEAISSLASGVRHSVELRSVTGAVAPLLSILTCTQLWMKNMELNQAATSSGVSDRVELRDVTGDVAPLLSSLTCIKLWIDNMELNQTATRGLVRGLQHGVKKLWLGYYGAVTLDIQSLVEYDGRGRGDLVGCYGNTAATYRENIKTWAERINWDVTEGGVRDVRRIVMRRRRIVKRRRDD